MEGTRPSREGADLLPLARGPRSVTELCEELDTYQSQVSGHLAALRPAGLVSAAKSGYFNVYRVNGRTLGLLSERLRELSGRGVSTQLVIVLDSSSDVPPSLPSAAASRGGSKEMQGHRGVHGNPAVCAIQNGLAAADEYSWSRPMAGVPWVPLRAGTNSCCISV